MAQKTRIKILVSDSTGTPLSGGNRILRQGELAYSYAPHGTTAGGDRLYIGTGAEDGSGIASAQEVIGGVYFTEMLDHSKGTLTANSAVLVNGNKHVDELNTAGLKLAASGSLGSAQQVTSIETSMPGSPTNAQLISAAGVKTYVDSLDRDDDLSLRGDGGSFTLDLDNHTLDIAGGTGLTTAATDGDKTLTVNMDSVLTDAGGSAGTYGSSSAIPQLTVNAQGQITAISTNAIATALTVDGDTGSETVSLLNDDLQILGTSNEIEVAVSKVSTDVKATIGLPNDVTIGNDLTVTTDLQVNGSAVIEGNLTVNGTTTAVNSTEITIDDPVQVLGDGTSSDDGLDRGIKFKYYDAASSTVKQGFFGFDGGANNAGTERFVYKKVISNDDDNLDSPWGDAEFNELYVSKVQSVSGDLTLEAAGSNNIVLNDNVDLNGALDVSGALSASSLTLTTDLAVAHGGTGASSFTSKGVLIGNGSSAIAVTAASSANGSILQADSGGTPAFSNVIDGGTY